MKICGTCQKPLEDQAKECRYCGMTTEPYGSPGFQTEYPHCPRWTLFPPITKTHWWMTELTLGPASKGVELNSFVSRGNGVFAFGPVLKLGVGLYEFCCLLSVDKIAKKPVAIGAIRILKQGAVIAQRTLKGDNFEAAYKETPITIRFQLDVPDEDIWCEFSSTGIVSLGITWLRLIPRFGWQWEGKDLYFDERALVSVSDRGVALKPYIDNDSPELWGPYIYLIPGYYQLIASVSVDPSEYPLVTEWQVFSAGLEIEPLMKMELDSLQQSKPQTVIRPFYMKSDYRAHHSRNVWEKK